MRACAGHASLIKRNKGKSKIYELSSYFCARMNFREEISLAVEILRKGGTIIYPTDTIWGLGCDATDPLAVKKIFEIKAREKDKSLIILVSGDAMLNRFVKEIPGIAWDLMDMANGPITIIYSSSVGLADGVAAHDGSVAVRVVKEGFCHALIHKFGRPIVSTSANYSGKPSPTNFKDIDSRLIKNVDHVVSQDMSANATNKPSSIVRLKMNGEIKIIRN